ncbi:MAG TPA: hypothetical protein VKG92_12215 [Flavobacteriales bacterium]|nr:hypothetical protein [Flavobacteriales bacterium]
MGKGLSFVVPFAVTTTCMAQYDLGLGVGAYVYTLHVSDPSGPGGGSPSITSDQAFPLTASIVYRDRMPEKDCNFFAEVSWSHRSFTAHLDEGGLGGGRYTHADVKLDNLYLGFGPEWGQGPLTVRTGIQIGWVLGGTVEGYYGNWSIYPPPEGDWSKGTISGSAHDYFIGDVRWTFALRYVLNIGKNLNLYFDPYMSPSFSSMLKDGDNKIRGVDFGLRVGVFSAFKGRGFWQRFRALAPDRIHSQ